MREKRQNSAFLVPLYFTIFSCWKLWWRCFRYNWRMLL